MNTTTFKTDKGELSLAQIFDTLKYSSYKENRIAGVSHEHCVKYLGMPESFGEGFSEEVVEKLKLAFFPVDNDSELED